MPNIREPVEPDTYYHIYSHAVGNENLFREDENYRYFLKKYAEYLNPISETFAYCLMPNHFHFLIRIKSKEELIQLYSEKYPRFKDPPGFQNTEGLNKLIRQNSLHIGNFFNAYSKAYNKKYNRKGPLFVPDFFRKPVYSADYLQKLVHYIHFNPVHHGFVSDLRDWKYSSFESFFSPKATSICRETVIEWFDDLANFLYFHRRNIEGFEPEFD